MHSCSLKWMSLLLGLAMVQAQTTYYISGNAYSGATCSGSVILEHDSTQAIQSGVCQNSASTYGVTASSILYSCSNGASTWWNYQQANCAGPYVVSSNAAGTCASFQLAGTTFSSSITCYSAPSGGTSYYLSGSEYSGASCTGTALLTYSTTTAIESGVCVNTASSFGVTASSTLASCANGNIVWYNFPQTNCAGTPAITTDTAGACNSFQLGGTTFSSKLNCYSIPSGGQKYYLSELQYSGSTCSGTTTLTRQRSNAVQAGFCYNADPAVYGVNASYLLYSCSGGSSTWWNYPETNCAGDAAPSTASAGTCGTFQLSGKTFSSVTTCYNTASSGGMISAQHTWLFLACALMAMVLSI